MPIEQIDFGQSLAGLLVDGVPETPYVGATLRLDEKSGTLVEVPYLSYDGTGQFKHVSEWFDSRTPPQNLLFMSTEGPITLFGLRWGGHSEPSGMTAARGSIQVGEAALGARDGELSDPLTMQQVRSWVDGLNEWTRLSSVSKEIISESDGSVSRIKGLTVTTETAVATAWPQGGANISLQSVWRSVQENDGRGRRHVIADDVVIESSFPDARPFSDHLTEQRKVANLLVLLYGQKIAFRRHQFRDPRYVTRVMSGEVIGKPFVEIVSEQTVRERVLPPPDPQDLRLPLADLAQIGADGMATWAENYDRWRRFILPAVSAMSRVGAFAEDIVVSTSTSLEAASVLIGHRDNEENTYHRNKPTTATHVYRCLDVVDIVWPEHVGGKESLARAIARNYNEIKHADRGDFPEARESILVSKINTWLVRLLALDLTGQGSDLLSKYRNSDQLWQLRQYLDGYDLRITPDGRWEARTT
ncbi:hypothetical protein L1785_12060 [Antribacter sp. KLBMP9083]|uniref:ApeA N-terminal domain-containing protein n=1 Tax=Antribacter soli TaxID=2910976 RepID=A0AA41QEL1_9MICO|nr:hypothetical protein [Antribacter soli]MCF4121717.1 hypothetical protein [Antribacter soli]